MRIEIYVVDNQLDDYNILSSYRYNYGVYPDAKGYYANNSAPYMSRGFMIQVIRTLMRRKNNRDQMYKDIRGISMNMMRRLRLDYDINAADILGGDV